MSHDPELDAARRGFARQTDSHVLEIIRDDGMYRHLRCQAPGTIMWGWDVITWPGYLAVHGDIGHSAFRRTPDMLLDFFGGPISSSYWLEKCVASDRPSRVVSAARVARESRYRFYELCDEADLTAKNLAALRHLDRVAEEKDGSDQFEELADAAYEVWDDLTDFDCASPSHFDLRILLAIEWTRARYVETKSAAEQ